MGLFDRFKKKDDDEKALSYAKMRIGDNGFLREIKPKEAYLFSSDYFKVDTYYATIMSFFHTSAASDNFGPFWGINRIPSGMPDGVTTVNFEQVVRMGEGWIQEHQNASEGVAQMNQSSQEQAGSNTSRARASRSLLDLEVIAQEINDGAAYLNVHDRILVKAPTLEKLDMAVAKLERLYLDRFGTVHAAPYIGEQRLELASLFLPNRRKRGKGFYFTSTEFAGSYSLVTHGLEDPSGEYVGYMVGDVNNSAVLFDVDKYRHHCVVASEQYDLSRNRAHVSDMWGSKMSQAAMLNGHRVIHLIFDGANLDELGPKFEKSTCRIDMGKGDLNMFEMFGSHEDELSVFPSQMQKLVLMAEQAYETTDSDRSIIRGSLEDVATRFYIDNRMWYENAIQHRDRLRVVGIPHEQVPRLEMFVSYLNMEYKAMTNATARDDERLHALSVLSTTFANLLSNNGDLFNTVTTSAIDDAVGGRRVIYDFSNLLVRGKGVAMAQLVNVIGFAVNNLSIGDVVIIHGAEYIASDVHDYVRSQLERFYRRGGRVVYLYNDINSMLDDQDFNSFDEADYTLFGNMSDNMVSKYQTQLGQSIPPDLTTLVTRRDQALCYVHRGFDNVVFHQDLRLDIVDAQNQGTSRRRRRRKRTTA